jgi:hypothetical protein
MEAVQKRVADRMAAERKELQASQMTLGKERIKLGKQIETALAAERKLTDSLRNGNVPSAAAMEAQGKRHKRIAVLVRELEANARHSTENAARLKALESGKELDRRVRVAESLGLDGPVAGPQAVEVILLHADGPMSVDELSRTALETGVVKLKGKTPTQTISAYLAKAAKKGDRFVRVGPAMYDLKTRPKVKA